MEQYELLKYAVDVLDELQIRYFVTGSIASMFFSEPRFTNDIDIVLQLPADRVSAFCERFPQPQFYVSQEAAVEAVRAGGQFNVIHVPTALKIDFMTPQVDEFDRGRFDRSRAAKVGDNWNAVLASPEDVVIKKMQYYHEGRSEKHLRDITSILRFGGTNIDHRYIEHWVERFDLHEIWRAIQSRLGQDR